MVVACPADLVPRSTVLFFQESGPCIRLELESVSQLGQRLTMLSATCGQRLELSGVGSVCFSPPPPPKLLGES